nr:efflux RND transporter permease subunit [Acidobacteriota bacterium]
KAEGDGKRLVPEQLAGDAFHKNDGKEHCDGGQHGAVIASVLTTIAVFFPIVFVEGIAGELFRDQSLTVTFSLIASLLAALSLIPMLASLGSKSKKKKPAKAAKANADDTNTMGFFSVIYEKFLRACLRWRWVTLAVAVAIFVFTLRLYPKLGQELIPALTEGEFFFEVSMPEGTALPTTDQVIAEMERTAAMDPAVETVYATVGTRTVTGGLSLKTKDENLGQVNVVLKDRSDEGLEEAVADRLRETYARIPNLDAKLGRPSFFSLKTPVEMLFYGEDLEQLKEYTLSLKPKLEEIPGLVDVRASLEAGNPELTVVFDRQKLAHLGLTIGQVSETLHNRVNGTVVSRFKEADRLIDIRLRNQESDRDSIRDIENIVIAELDGRPITLKAVAALTPARGPSEIHRISQSRVAILSGDLSGRPLGAVMADVQEVVAQNPPPIGIEATPGGQNKEMEASFGSLMFALGLAVFLVYLVMAATFENLVHPFIILFTIPLALVGAILGLYWSGLSVSIIALIGVIFLAGVVVNNAIVLVDAVNQSRHAGHEKMEAVIHAAKIRLRPILMTTMTTVLGLLPMAIGFGEGSELRTPLAVVVSTGLVISTLLTLVVIPAVYMIVPSTVSTVIEEEELENDIAAAVQREYAELHPAEGLP